MRQRLVRDGRLDREPLVAELLRFLDLALHEMHLEVQYEVATPEAGPGGPEGLEVLVTFRGPDQDLLLGRNAEVLQALEYLALRWLGLEPRFHDHLRFDCGDFRALRIEELKLSARLAAQRVRETRQAFRFNPMPARERRIIHLELNGATGVRTASEGMGDHRQLVIHPDDSKK